MKEEEKKFNHSKKKMRKQSAKKKINIVDFIIVHRSSSTLPLPAGPTII